jgi:hypothetical protein
MSIHTFGDSHSSTRISGWKDCNNVIAHELGALLCYSFGKEKLNRFDIRNYDIIFFHFSAQISVLKLFNIYCRGLYEDNLFIKSSKALINSCCS